jgi:epsin
LAKFEKKNWRVSYNSLIVLEHLLTHGPESVADQLKGFQYIDQQGYVCLLFFSFQFWLKLGH